MQEKPMVSVVMSVHNGQRFLGPAIESILAQTYPHFEFLIMDDGSTDGTAAFLRDYENADRRLRVITQSNSGLTKSLNRLLEEARGTYIARMDADDIAMPRRLEKQVEVFENDPPLVLLGSEVELVTESGLFLGSRNTPRDHHEIRRRLLVGDGSVLTHPVVMFRASVLQKAGFYDDRFETVQDLDFFLRLSECGEVRNLPEVLLHWRQHPSSANQSHWRTWPEMKRMAIQRAIKRIGPEQFAAELFPEPQSVKFFPKTSLELAYFAECHGRASSAWMLSMRAFRDGDRILHIVLFQCRLFARLLGRKLKELVR